ncbi:MAG TPA: PAS domain S-box protein [Gemmatimonadales bacterium]|nr:PAS domain S-box protein [Gemmatimonadales bacterium]
MPPRMPPERTGDRGLEQHGEEPGWFAEAVLATLREPLLVLDAALRVVIGNRAFYRAFGGTPEETVGQPLYELRGRLFDSPALRALLEAVLPNNTAFDDFVHSVDLPALGRRVLLLNARRLYRDKHKTDMILLAMEDVTEKHAAAEARARLAAIVDSSHDAILSKSLDGTIRTWNAAAERLYGYTEAEAVGQHIGLIVPPERRAEAASILERISRGERVESLDTERIRKDGSRLHVSVSISPVRDATGRVIGASAIERDITERMRVEQALREAAQLLEGISSASPAVLHTMTVQDNGTLVPTWVSRNVTAVLGFSVDEALAPGWWTAHVHPDDRAECLARMEQLLARGSLVHEYRFLRKDGTVVWIRDELRVVRDSAGRPRQVMGAWLDTTEQHRLEEQFLQAQKMESVGRLAGGVAHDFNNLLTVITGTVDLALRGLQEGDPLAEDLKEIQRAARRGAALTQHLLAFSRRQVFQPKVVNLNETLAELEPMVRRLLGEDIRLVTVLGGATGNVRVDPGQLTQVVMNLVVNSRDAMPSGGTLTLETANVDLDEAYAGRHLGVTPGPYVMLAVTDTGSGMDEATRQRAFEPFFTTKGAGRGTGLGLSTVYGIVKQSGGNIWVYSEPGVGTTFKIYLPRVAEPVTATETPLPPSSARGSETVMLVEDNAGLREVARRILEAAGYAVLAAGTPGEALLSAERFHGPIHLVLTDVVMPTMRGPELAERVIRLHPEARILYMSGYAENAIVHGGELAEGTHFISKPFDAATLTRRVREVLDRPA